MSLEISVNGQQHQVGRETNISMLADQLKLPASGCALAVNGQVIPRSQWTDHRIKDADCIDIFGAVAGG